MTTSGKWRSEIENRRYNKSWEDRFEWLSESPNNPDAAYCNVCKLTLRPKTSLLAAHENSSKHLEAVGKSSAEMGELNESYGDDAEFLGRAPLSDFSNLANLDPEDIMEVVGSKLMDHYTLWDLVLIKAKLSDIAAMDTILDEVGQTLKELRAMIESCMVPREKGRAGRPSEPTILLDKKLAAGMGIQAGRWKRRPLDEIEYESVIDLRKLLRDGRGSRKSVKLEPLVEIKKEVDDDNDEADEDADEQEKNDVEAEQSIDVIDEDDKDEEENPKAMKTEPDMDDGLDENDDEIGRDDEDDEDFDELEERRSSRGRKRGRPAKTTAAKKKGKRSYMCKNCGKDYTNETSCLAHEKKCGVGEEGARIRFKVERVESGGFLCSFANCSQAGVEFESREKVEEHFATEHVQECHKIIPCILCDEKFALVSMRNAHMRNNHEKNISCEKCDRRFWLEKDRDAHVARLHSAAGQQGAAAGGGDGSLVPCQKCGRLLHEYYVRQHENKCSGLSVRHPEYKKVGDEYICTVAGCNINYGFNSVYGLRLHFHTVHVSEEERVFHCDYCDARFAFNTTRNKHVREIHLKVHQCQYCPKRFGAKEKLRQHIRTHTGEKPYQCDRCEYRASKKYNLDEHKRVRHNDQGTGTYSCGVCGKLFTTSGRVRRHIVMIHQEGKTPRGTATPGATTRRQKGKGRAADADQEHEVQMVVTSAPVREHEMAVEFLTTELQVQHQEEAPWQ